MTRKKSRRCLPRSIPRKASVGKTRRRITINIDGETVDYFKAESRRTGVPYQTIINLYLTECREQGKRLSFVQA